MYGFRLKLKFCICSFSVIWKNSEHNSARYFYSTNALNIDRLLAFTGILWIRDEEGRFENVTELSITALMCIVPSMTIQMGSVLTEMSE